MSLALVSDTTGEIISGRIITINSKPEAHLGKSDFRSEGIRKIVELIQRLDSLFDVFDHYGVDDLVHFYAFGVHREYRDRGIGTQVMKDAVAFAKSMGLDGVVIKGEGGSLYSQKIYENLGFETLGELFYEQVKEGGKVVFETGPVHKSERQYGKRIVLQK